jgi:hypothetical protein
MQKYEAVFDYLHASFVTNLAIYRNSLEELLSPLALSDTKLFSLLEKFDTNAWQEPDLVSSLRQRLGSSLLPFRSSTKQLHKKITLFAHKLQLDEKFKVSVLYKSPSGLTFKSRHGSLILEPSISVRETRSSRTRSTESEAASKPRNTNSCLRLCKKISTGFPH